MVNYLLLKITKISLLSGGISPTRYLFIPVTYVAIKADFRKLVNISIALDLGTFPFVGVINAIPGHGCN